MDENHLLQPVDVNGINKISGEFYHLVYHQVYGIRASSLRLTNVYGPRQDYQGAYIAVIMKMLDAIDKSSVPDNVKNQLFRDMRSTSITAPCSSSSPSPDSSSSVP